MKKTVTRIIMGMLAALAAIAVGPLCAFGTLENEGVNPAAAQGAIQAGTVPSSIDMVLVFDVSDSMNDQSALTGSSKLQNAQNQGTAFINSIRQGQSVAAAGISTMLGIVSFSDSSRIEHNLSSNTNELTTSIANMTTGNMTNMYAGLQTGIEMLESSQSSVKILVLLSDGMNNQGHSDSEIRALANQAANDGIIIYTIGYGSASSLDEELLEYLAAQTGGLYAHEDSSDIYGAAVGIFSTLKQAELLASGETIISESIGTVSQGQTIEIDPVVMPQSGDMTAYLYWPGSKLTLQFTDPAGVQVTSSYPGYTIDNSVIPTKIVIKDAMAGTWTATVTGVEVSMAQEPFYAVTSFSPFVVGTGGGGGGGSTNSGMIFLLMIAVVGIGAVLITYAMSKRKTN